MSAPRPSEEDVEARLVEYERAWLWNEATDETLAGWGYHMGQMLYRLPRDGQTRDMQASIEAMLADLRDLAARDAEHERKVAALRAESDKRVEGNDYMHRALSQAKDRENLRLTARAEAAERALADRDAAIKALADQIDAGVASGLGGDRAITLANIATRLRALLPRDDAAGAGGGA